MEEDTPAQMRRKNFSPGREAVAIKRRNEISSQYSPAKKRIAHTPSWSSTSTTTNPSRLKETLDEKVRRFNSSNQSAIDDKKYAILLNDAANINKRISSNPVIQMKMLLFEIKQRIADGAKVFYISDDNNGNTSETANQVFCFEKGNTQCLYQARYYSQESGTYRKINYRKLRSSDLNLDQLYRAFKKIGFCQEIIVHSNKDLDEESLRRKDIKVINNENNTCSIKVDRKCDFFKEMVKKHSDIYKLAEDLSRCMKNTKFLKPRLNEKFQVMLIRERVLIVTQNDRRDFIAKFHPNFINCHALKPVITELYHYLMWNLGELRSDHGFKVNANFGKPINLQTYSFSDVTDVYSIESFFTKLRFITCEEDVEDKISGMGETFEKIQSIFHVEQLNIELSERLKRDREMDQTDLFISLERKILCCELINYHRNKNYENQTPEFARHSLQRLNNILKECGNSTIIVKSDNPHLCALKLQQLSTVAEPKYSKDRCFLLDIDELLSAKKHLLTVFSGTCEHLLIVRTDGINLKDEQVKYCIKDIRQQISNAPNVANKMIIIQNVNDLPLELNFDFTRHEELFNDQAGLTEASQDELSEILCKLYSCENTTNGLPLKELLLQSSHLADLLSSAQCVNELIKSEELILEKNLIKPTLFEATYILPRRLKRHINLNLNVIKERNNDIFVISEFEKPSYGNVHYYKDTKYAQFHFNDFRSKNPKVDVHLLKAVSNRDSIQLVWQKSSRSILPLMKYTVECTEATEQSESIDDVLDQRILILCGKPYSGKSYCLFDMAAKLNARQIENGNHKMEKWIVQINLNKSMMQQDALSSPPKSPNDAVIMLTKILGYDELHCRLFRLSAIGELKMKLSIFVDGLEELSKDDLHIISKILRLLRETNVERIYVATRPNFRKILERALDEFAFNLVTFSKADNKNILLNTWLPLANENITKKEVCDTANNVLNSFKTIVSIREPLYLQIFARICWHYIKDRRHIPQMKTIHDIFQQYFDTFLNLFDISKRNRFCMYHLATVLPPESISALKLYEGERFAQEYSKLNHSSFIEYGAAKWLASLQLDDQIMAFSMIQDLAMRVSNVFFETFSYNCSKHLYVEYIKRIGNNRLLVELFRQHIWNHTAEQGRLVYLHTALEYSEDLFKLFLNLIKDSGSNQISFIKLIDKENLVMEAAQKNKVNQVCELMLRGANIEKLPANFVKCVATHVVSTLVELQPNQLHPYWSIVENLLKITQGVCANIDSSLKLPRLLRYFFAHGRKEVIDKILQELDEPKKLLRTRIDGLTPLEIVNSSEKMTDADRLKISEYLISDNSEQNVFPVLTAAAKCGHVECFQHFAGTDRERLSNFFKKALRSNQLDVLRFLLRNKEWVVDCTSARNGPLHVAVIVGASIKTLKFLLERGGENNKNDNKETALSLAIQRGADLRIIKFLLDHHADVNVSDSRGLKPWCYAVLDEFCRYSPEKQLELMSLLKSNNKKLELIKPENNDLKCWEKEIKPKYEYLLNPKNYNLNFKARTVSRLHLALWGGEFVWLNFLLQHGADPNLLDSENFSLLHMAASMENSEKLIETVRKLLRQGAIYNVICKKGLTPLDILRARKNSTTYKGQAYKLLKRAQDFFEHVVLLRDEAAIRNANDVETTALYWLLYCRDNRKRTLLHRAAEQALPQEDLKNLLKFSELFGEKRHHRAWIDARDMNGETAAHAAARLGNSYMIEELAQKGACLELQNVNGETPLNLAKHLATYSKLEMARNLFRKVSEGSLDKSLLLCTKYFCANIRDERGRTLLHLAASGQDASDCLLLIRWQASVDATDDKGKTPLHYTVSADNLEATKLLIKVGASADARDVGGKRPADENSSRSADLVYTLAEMLEKGWRDELGVNGLVYYLDRLEKKFGLEPRVAASACDSDKNTLVHHAVRNCDLKLLKALLNHGAVYNACNAANRTPMDLADGKTKSLLKVVDDIFKNQNVDLWKTKIRAVDWELITRCRKVGGYTLLHASLDDGHHDAARWLIDKDVDVNVTNNLNASAKKVAEGFQLI